MASDARAVADHARFLGYRVLTQGGRTGADPGGIAVGATPLTRCARLDGRVDTGVGVVLIKVSEANPLPVEA